MTSPLAAQGEYFESRQFAEESHPLRNEFQRDRDRVVHSKYFRRLEYKTQVFVNHLGDNFRTRLTHSIEVSQIARTVARVLGLNEDLTETVALAHDLGHPPFGHAGERALHEKMRELGGFDHNEQTLRIVTTLEERYPNFTGLNLTRGTLASLQKHSSLPKDAAGKVSHGHCLEAIIVDMCDEIAYNNHDIDDGLESGHLTLQQLSEVKLWHENYKIVGERYPGIKPKIQIRATIREIINGMVSNLIEASRQNIAAANLDTFEDVLRYNADERAKPLIAFSDKMDAQVKDLKKFLFRNLYRHADVVRMNERANHIISRIFDFVIRDPKMLPADYHERIETMGVERVVADFIAGMTDRYALHWNTEILGAHAR
ncbi:deoxyguanosinetriphosphate triphosphohydrolase [Turneriella parva]|uniref:Deoxyguanosinetriphosphate triphosphohydrolase-like protein n=1 Tax=Turneriella parva (strain ATCC BAA-1111 / DSM 21527 / NCTC 11395 / H) TaxID=869212 RepID=I4B4J5_TURPD|nr:deoxyguanosinetriphosphate triphosphohydrolase [Turneriella parva]AFM12202.1 Deoxyguanosinetriphosphate triphosphohydrolase-like protein [Turneriella parva DSM 21527]